MPVYYSQSDNKKGVADISDNALEWTERGANPAVLNFAGLEPQLSDKVYTTRVSTLSGDQTERSRIEVLSTENEIRMVQNVDGRGLDLKPYAFRERDPLRHTKVEVEVLRPVEAVHREIAE